MNDDRSVFGFGARADDFISRAVLVVTIALVALGVLVQLTR